MHRTLTIALALSLPKLASAQTTPTLDEIAQAVSALPTSLRADATILEYASNGDPVVLRQGNNTVFCVAAVPAHGFSSRCYANALRPQRDLEAKLRAEGKNESDMQTAVKAAVASNQLPRQLSGTTRYVRIGTSEADARSSWVILLPGATANSTGLPAEAGGVTPWLVQPGTAGAYLVVPQGSDR
jgi:hypothetical protein